MIFGFKVLGFWDLCFKLSKFLFHAFGFRLLACIALGISILGF